MRTTLTKGFADLHGLPLAVLAALLLGLGEGAELAEDVDEDGDGEEGLGEVVVDHGGGAVSGICVVE